MKKILIVEDDTLLNKILTYTWLRKATTSHLLLPMPPLLALKKCEFDLVLLAINLPDGSGLDFCREIREGGLNIAIFPVFQ